LCAQIYFSLKTGDTLMQTSLQGQVAWVTGGGSGIGLAGATALVKAGAHVVISGRNAQTNASALAVLQAVGSAEAVLLDVADKYAVKSVAEGLLATHKRIDILVNSAGTNATKRNFDVLTTDAWDDVVAINLSGSFYCVLAVLPAMRAQGGGLIINVSSWAGLYASKLTGPAYNATKRAVLALTESINMEECGHGIRASSVLPGEVATPIMLKRPVPPAQALLDLMVQVEDMGEAIGFIAQMPARSCINELIISPTHNRFYLGGFETPPQPK
jgi:NAD(P)-dependent dehydrogenase (short-subunit alcohol dehydrogenase family)